MTAARLLAWNAGRWHADVDADERTVLALVKGPVLDVGCGPARVVRHFARSGMPALGIDVSTAAVEIATQSGIPALRRNVFDPVPGEGRWGAVVLIDGNIGIGGDPWRLVARSAELLAGAGRIVVELDPTASGVERHPAQIDATGPAFPWATVGADAAGRLAASVGATVVRCPRFPSGRTFAVLETPAAAWAQGA